MIFPIGRYAGTAGDCLHVVRVGGRTEHLDPTIFAAWGLAHGPVDDLRRPVDPVLAATVPWTRAELVRYAGLAGLAQPDQLVTGLAERGMVAEAPATGPQAIAFARAHRVVPLAVGLGNDPEAPARFAIGLADRVLAEVDEPRFEMWCWSTVYENLWEVCQSRATATPEHLLGHVLTGMHELTSANALYLEAWTLAHGLGELSDDQPWGLTTLVEHGWLMAEVGLAEAAAGLAARGLLVEVDPAGAAAFDFASTHRLRPLLLAFGPDPSEPDSVLLGTAHGPAVALSEFGHAVWQAGQDAPTLWDTCQAVAEVDAAVADPQTLLPELLSELHGLLGAGAAYLDRRVGGRNL